MTGCAAVPDSSVDEGAINAGSTSNQACFYKRQVQDFEVLDRSNFIVYAPNKSRPYHVRISPPSTDLKFANALAFSSRGNRICGYAGDTVLIGVRNDRRYSVTGVYRLDEIMLEQVLGAYGNVDIETEPTEGAEIERDLEGSDDE